MIKMINMIKKTKLLIIVVGVLLTACFEKEVAPVLEFPGEANMTIAEFQQLHTLSPFNPVTLIDTNAIITGIVISTDEFGSCYQELFFQDETGGISIRIASSRTAPYYSRYRIGQRIFVKAKGLHLGNYVSSNPTNPSIGFYQLGAFGNGRLNNLIRSWENRHIFRSELPNPLSPIIAPKIITSETDIVDAYYHTLVRLENCYFAEAGNGARYYEERLDIGGSASQPIRFNQGSGEVIARISTYNTFANDTLPEGAVNITGILTWYYNERYGVTNQFIIRSINDVEIPPPAEILASFDMTTDPFKEGWTNKQVTGTEVWNYYQGARLQISSTSETECWLVSPKFDFSGKENVALFLTYRLLDVLDGASENVQILYTTDDGTNWEPFNFIPQINTTTDVILKLNDNIATHPNLQIAFKYKTTTFFPTWLIRNITFKANVR